MVSIKTEWYVAQLITKMLSRDF